MLAATGLLVLGTLLRGADTAGQPAWAAPQPQRQHHESRQTLHSLDRTEDAVIVTGDKLPSFEGVAIDQLFVYAYSGGVWKQIPWQFDEVAGGHITATEDALLDADDQLIFMASDTGDQSPTGSWIDNAGSQQYPRYEITVSDPISPARKGWVYVYRSATDTDTVTTDYVDYDETQWLFTSSRYTMGVIPYRMTVERLEMNGSGVDILDRTKFRIYVPDLTLLLTEENVSLAETPTVRDGRVRAFITLSGGSNEITLMGYRSRYEFISDMDFSQVITSVGWMRLSADLSPAAVGSTYYDLNTSGGVPVDGHADPVATSPATDWWQVSGSSGTVVQIADLSQLGITRTNYYKDDETIDPNDTGDQRSYADCGTHVDHPDPHMVFHLWYYVLPANQANVGAVYRDYARNPLQSVASEQTYNPISTWDVYLPTLMRSRVY
jgi:hypothetical protein